MWFKAIEQDGRRPRHSHAVVALFAGGVLLALLAALYAGRSLAQPASPGHDSERYEASHARVSGADLAGDVRFTGVQFIITNHGASPWEDVTLTLHSDEGTGTRYKAYVTRVAAGHAVSVREGHFAASDGRTVAADARPRSLLVSARLGAAGARGVFEARWR